MKNSTISFLFSLLGCVLPLLVCAQESDVLRSFSGSGIHIVDRTDIENTIEHPISAGKIALENAIIGGGGSFSKSQFWSKNQEGPFIIVGTFKDRVIYRLVKDEPLIEENKPEGTFYLWRTTSAGRALIIGGTDSRGLMYALNEIAKRINDGGLDELNAVENSVQYPTNEIRGIDKFLTDQNDESWFFSEDYWNYYLNLLATNRFNRFTLITGYNEGDNEDFMIPVYPYLLDVPGFNKVAPRNKMNYSPSAYLKQLRRIGELCHSLGMEFVLGLWGHGKSDGLVAGLPESDDNYTRYCADGLRVLLRNAPVIDGIQLRVNYESGVGGFGQTAELFWKEIIKAVGDIHKERMGSLFLDIRAKGITESIRECVLANGLDLHITSKYTWEGMGLPYHPTQMRQGELEMLDNVDKRQRYGYADFLKASRSYDFIYRLWGIGTNRIFTWADPDYAKRFSKSASFGGSRGFQLTPPMARKHNTWDLIPNDSLRYYRWEDERYWAWYTLFGRLGYSPDTKPRVWEREFKEHYGPNYEALLNAYGHAGKVLPFITSTHLTAHPANYNWAEIESGGALFVENNANPLYIDKKRTYQSTEPGDPGMFYSIEGFVSDVISRKMRPKISPIQLANYYDVLASEIFTAISNVQSEVISNTSIKEIEANLVDLKILAALASYHSYKIRASVDFVFYDKTGDSGYLLACLESMDEAIEQWQEILSNTKNLYFERPMFLTDNGTWQDRLDEMEKDVEQIKYRLKDVSSISPLSYFDKIMHVKSIQSDGLISKVPTILIGNKELEVFLLVDGQRQKKFQVNVHYRSANMTEGIFETKEMDWNGNEYTAKIPKNELDPQYQTLIYFSISDGNGNVSLNPGLFTKDFGPPYYILSIEEL